MQMELITGNSLLIIFKQKTMKPNLKLFGLLFIPAKELPVSGIAGVTETIQLTQPF
jgi:hypothetical protein